MKLRQNIWSLDKNQSGAKLFVEFVREFMYFGLFEYSDNEISA